jgi:hypothetical protein
MANVLREHQTQVPLTEDQHTVGQFGSESADEPFGETVRPRATRRNPDHLDAHIGEDGVEGCCELAGPVANEDPERNCCVARSRGRRGRNPGWSDCQGQLVEGSQDP